MLMVDAKKLAELVGQNLRRIRLEYKASLGLIGKRTGLRVTDLQRAEDGSRLLLLPELVAVSLVLGVPCGDLLFGAEDTSHVVR